MEDWQRDLMCIIGYYNGDDSELMQSLLKFRDTYLSDSDLEWSSEAAQPDWTVKPFQDMVAAYLKKPTKPKIEPLPLDIWYPPNSAYRQLDYLRDSKIQEIINHINEKQGG